MINLLAFALFLVWLSDIAGFILINVGGAIGLAIVGLYAAAVGWWKHKRWLRAEMRVLRVARTSESLLPTPLPSISMAADNLPTLPPVLPARLFDASDQTPDAVYCPQCVIEESHGWVYEPVGDPVYCVGHRYSTLAHAHRRLRANGGEIA